MVLPTYRVLFSQLTSLKILSQTGLGVCLQMILIPVNFTSKINHQSFYYYYYYAYYVYLLCVCVCMHLHKYVCTVTHTQRSESNLRSWFSPTM